jgi:hypothetical protein
MRTLHVLVRGVCGEHPAEVQLSEDQHPVGEFGADGQDEANGFGCVLIRRPTARNWYRALALPAGLAEFTLLPVLVGATPPAAVADPVRTSRNVRRCTCSAPPW